MYDRSDVGMSEEIILFDLRIGDKADWGDFFWKHLIDVCKGERSWE